MADNVPYAPPPKFSPDVMGERLWNEQMQAHKAWLESRKVTDATEDGGGLSPNPTDDSNDQDEKDEKPMKRKDSGKPGVFNVYGIKNSGKAERLAKVEADSPGDAIDEVKKGLDPMLNPYVEYEARRQRGAGFKSGADKRRRNDPGTGKPQRDGVGDEAAQAEFDAPGEQAEGKGTPGQGEQEQKPEPPQADDIILHRLQSAPLIGKDAEEKIKEIAAQAGADSTKIEELISEAITAMDATKASIAQAIQDAMAQIKTQTAVTIKLVQPDGTVTELDEHTHPLFQEVIKLATRRKPVYLFGASGTGKTYMAEQVARALFPDLGEAERYFSISATMGMSESHLQGWRLPLSAGEFVYIPSEFVKKFENGGVYLLDEVDRSDPNVLAVLNQALANRRLPLPARFEKPYAAMHPDFVMLAAGNTAGTGADRLYTAATRLDEAFLDRFRLGTLRMGYDAGLEEKLVGNTILLRAFWFVRQRCDQLNIERVISTRSIVEFSEYFGGTDKASAKLALERVTTTWEKAELNKIDFNEALAA